MKIAKYTIPVRIYTNGVREYAVLIFNILLHGNSSMLRIGKGTANGDSSVMRIASDILRLSSPSLPNYHKLRHCRRECWNFPLLEVTKLIVAIHNFKVQILKLA